MVVATRNKNKKNIIKNNKNTKKNSQLTIVAEAEPPADFELNLTGSEQPTTSKKSSLTITQLKKTNKRKATSEVSDSDSDYEDDDSSQSEEEIADLKKVRGKVFKKKKPTDHFDAKVLKETTQKYLDDFRKDLSLELVEGVNSTNSLLREMVQNQTQMIARTSTTPASQVVLHAGQISPRPVPPQTSQTPPQTSQTPPQTSQTPQANRLFEASLQANRVSPPTNLVPSPINQVETPLFELIQQAQPSIAQFTSLPVTQPHSSQPQLPQASRSQPPRTPPVAQRPTLPFNGNIERPFDPFQFNRMLLNVKNRACSLQNYAALLLEKMFSLEELLNPNFNVTGRLCKGSSGVSPLPLDPNRIEFIRQTIYSHVNGDEELKFKTWSKCKKAMSKMLSKIRLKNANIRID